MKQEKETQDQNQADSRQGPMRPEDPRLTAALKQNDVLNEQLKKLEDERDALKELVDAGNMMLKKFEQEAIQNHDFFMASLKDLEAAENARADLQKKLSTSQAGLPDFDCGVVDGKVFKVVHRTTAKWVNVEVLRHHVLEDATALVLERTGD